MAKAQKEAETQEEGVNFEDNEDFTFNMKETEADTGIPPMPKGNYNCSIEEAVFKISASKGNPMLSLKWAVEDGEYAEQNRKLFSFVIFSEKMIGRAKTFFKRVAPELAELEEFKPKAIAESGVLVGKRARLKVDVEDSEEYGKRNTVKDVFAPLAGGVGGAFQM